VLDIIDRIICEELYINVPFSNNCKKDVDTVITISYSTHMEPSIMRGRGRRRKMSKVEFSGVKNKKEFTNYCEKLKGCLGRALRDTYRAGTGHKESLSYWLDAYQLWAEAWVKSNRWAQVPSFWNWGDECFGGITESLTISDRYNRINGL
jgi:hypothetical protein